MPVSTFADKTTVCGGRCLAELQERARTVGGVRAAADLGGGETALRVVDGTAHVRVSQWGEARGEGRLRPPRYAGCE